MLCVCGTSVNTEEYGEGSPSKERDPGGAPSSRPIKPDDAKVLMESFQPQRCVPRREAFVVGGNQRSAVRSAEGTVGRDTANKQSIQSHH